MVMRTGLKIYRMTCPKCAWTEICTIRAGNPMLFIINLLTGNNRLPSQCPKCGNKLDTKDETKYWKT